MVKVGLAQSSDKTAAFEGLLWVGAIVSAFLLAVALVHHFGNRRDASRRDVRAGFTLDQLRRLRDKESLSAAEYDAIKRESLHGSQEFPSCEDGRFAR